MKRSILMCVAALAVCCNNLEVCDSEELPLYNINFTVNSIDTLSSRGAMVYSQSDMATMGLFCAATLDKGWAEWSATALEEDFTMYNTPLYYSTLSRSWLYGDAAATWDYLSLDDNYSFFGYSPFGSTSNGITSCVMSKGVMTLDLQLPSTASEQVDLLVARAKIDISPTLYNPVSLSFFHVLSAVQFTFEGLGNCISVESVTLSDVVGSATLEVWADGESFSTSWGSLGDASASFTLEATDEYFMMIPQELSSYAKVTILFEDDGVYQSREVEIGSLREQWEMGVAYNYIYNYEQEAAESGVINLDEYDRGDSDELAARVKSLIDSGVSPIIITGTFDDDLLETILDAGATSIDLSSVSGFEVSGNSFDRDWSDVEILVLPSDFSVENQGNTYNIFRRLTSLKVLDLSATAMSSISNSAFANFGDRCSIEVIILPESLERIYNSAFKDFETLTAIYIYSNLTVIEDNAFDDCRNLYYIFFEDANSNNITISSTTFEPTATRYYSTTYSYDTQEEPDPIYNDNGIIFYYVR